MDESKETHNKSFTISLNPWWLALALALLSGVLGFLTWRGTDSTNPNDRTVTVTGETTLKAEPDEYVFYPSYEFKNPDKTAGLSELTAKSDEVVSGLKKVGVADRDIKTDAGGYRDYYYFNRETSTHTYTLTVTVTVHDRDMAQKVQDYLTGTSPSGAVSPNATFSKAKRIKLESQGRDEATKDARAKAEQQAKNLGFTVGKVKNVSDSGGGVDTIPMLSSEADTRSMGPKAPSLSVQPGENDLNYFVTVTYYIR